MKRRLLSIRGHLRDHRFHGAGTELPPPQVAHAAGIAVEPAAAGGVDEIHHLDPLVIVEIPLQDIAPGRTDGSRRRMIAEVVVDGLQAAVLPVREELPHPPFRLPEEDGIGVLHRLFGVEHRPDPPADHRNAPAAVLISDLPSPFHLAGQHHGDADDIGGALRREGLDVFIDEFHLPLRGKGGGEDHRTVRRQVELGLPVQFLPAGIDQSKFHLTVPLMLPGKKPSLVPISQRRPPTSRLLRVKAPEARRAWPEECAVLSCARRKPAPAKAGEECSLSAAAQGLLP